MWPRQLLKAENKQKTRDKRVFCLFFIKIFPEVNMTGKKDLSERIEEVLFGGLTKDERDKAIKAYREIDSRFKEVRDQIELARSVPDHKWIVPIH